MAPAKRPPIGTVLTYLLLILAALFYLMPLYVIAVTSLKPVAEATLDNMWALPSRVSFAAYAKAAARLAPHFLNTLYLVVPATVISALIGSVNGYVLAKWRFRGADLLFTFLMLGMFVPYQAVLIPLIRTLQVLGLYNTIAGLVLVHVIYGIPITTLIFRNFYANIPDAMIEAARIDGATMLAIYRYLAIPLSGPGFVVVGIWQFTQVWNEFLFAVTVTGARQHPIMVAVQNLAGSQIVEWNTQMAGALLAALPTILVYILMGRWFVRGLLAGALKG